MYPGDVLRKNLDVVLATFILLGVGFYFGTRPQTIAAIKSDLAQRDVTAYRNVPKTTIDILFNNAVITAFSTIGVLYAVYAAVFQVGIVYGAIWVINGPLNFLLVMVTFGLLEFLASFLGIFGGLYVLKRAVEYVLFKLVGRIMSDQNALYSVGLVFAAALGLLVPGAIIEAFLLYSTLYNPFFLPFVVIGGAFVTGVLYYYVVFKKSKD